MASKTTSVQLVRKEAFRFEATNSLGKTAILDGPASIGGADDGVRPMEMVLMGLAGCSSFDVMSMINKARLEVDKFVVSVEAKRAESEPPVFEKIHLIFEVDGNFDEARLNRFVSLSIEKYCSVAAMLRKTAEISFEVIANGKKSS